MHVRKKRSKRKSVLKKRKSSKKKKQNRKKSKLSNAEIKKRLKNLKEKNNVKLYTPLKYFEGLSAPREVDKVFYRMLRGRENKKKKDFSVFETDKSHKSRKVSSYTEAFRRHFPDAKTLEEKSKATGIPLSIVRALYKKGLSAWRTGHRPGATAQQWGYARVHSFAMGGCTIKRADNLLFQKAMSHMSERNRRAWKRRFIGCH